MKNTISAFVIMLFLGQLAMALKINDPDLVAVMNKNSNHSGTNYAAAKITYKAVGNGVPVTAYLFAKETSNNLTLTTYIGGVQSGDVPSSNDDWGTKQYVFSASPAAGATVQFKLHATVPNPGIDYYNDQKAGDNLFHMMPKGSFSWDYNGVTIPPGIWMGWEDWLQTTGGDMDYNDICMVVQGLEEYATDNTGHTVLVTPPPANMGTRIMSWVEENKFQP